MKSPQRKLAIAFAVSSIALLGAAAVLCRESIERAYHLARLRSDPSRFESMLFSGSAARELASRDFIREPAGKEELFRLYLIEFSRATSTSPDPRDAAGRPAFLASMLRGPFDRAAIALWEEGHTCFTWRPKAHSVYSLTNLRSDRRRLRMVLELIAGLSGGTFRLPEVDGLEFVIASAADVRDQAARENGPGGILARTGWGPDAIRAITASVHPEVEFVCLFRRA